MPATVTFFPVDNGDMTLIELESGRTVLIDINMRQPDDGIRDVAKDLRKRLKQDAEGRPYVDAFLLSHPDQDHCRGLRDHFHLGPLSDYPEPEDDEDPKIIIREMWSSPIVFRRAERKQGATLSDDAKAWRTEARRRVQKFRDNGWAASGDRIQVLGEDENGKTDNLGAILVKARERITTIDGSVDGTFEVMLIAPSPKGSDEEEEVRSKNNSSVIVNIAIAKGFVMDACKFLTGGDAEVAVWERVWADHKDTPDDLAYDLMQTPHHCSWHSLSYDSWSEMGEDVEISEDAREALGQARNGSYIVASSKVIMDDDSDPPCIRAEREYKEITKEAKGEFVNTATHPSKKDPAPMEFEVSAGGVTLKKGATPQKAAAVVGAQPLIHG
ncbi:metallohydrolase [Inquilinus sp. CAU 1745]|uniref:metallohydrolase n=1 Tax=Inquilinus sp. CAU 1745 TaxID=3140369 RepID=UPI00325BB20A